MSPNIGFKGKKVHNLVIWGLKVVQLLNQSCLLTAAIESVMIRCLPSEIASELAGCQR